MPDWLQIAPRSLHRVLAGMLVLALILPSTPVAVFAQSTDPGTSDAAFVTEELKILEEFKPELTETAKEERVQKLTEKKQEENTWSKRRVIEKLKSNSVESIGMDRDYEQEILSELKEEGVIATVMSDDGSEVQIDSDLQRDFGSDIIETAETPYLAEIGLSAADGFVIAEDATDAGQIFSAEENEQIVADATPHVREEIRYFNHAANPSSATYEGNKLIYPELWDAVDMLLTTTDEGVKEDIILKNNTAQTEFNYIVETIGLQLQTTDDGGFEFVDETDQTKFYTPAPDLTDAMGTTITNGIRYLIGWGQELDDDEEIAVAMPQQVEAVAEETKEVDRSVVSEAENEFFAPEEGAEVTEEEVTDTPAVEPEVDEELLEVQAILDEQVAEEEAAAEELLEEETLKTPAEVVDTPPVEETVTPIAEDPAQTDAVEVEPTKTEPVEELTPTEPATEEVVPAGEAAAPTEPAATESTPAVEVPPVETAPTPETTPVEVVPASETTSFLDWLGDAFASIPTAWAQDGTAPAIEEVIDPAPTEPAVTPAVDEPIDPFAELVSDQLDVVEEMPVEEVVTEEVILEEVPVEEIVEEGVIPTEEVVEPALEETPTEEVVESTEEVLVEDIPSEEEELPAEEAAEEVVPVEEGVADEELTEAEEEFFAPKTEEEELVTEPAEEIESTDSEVAELTEPAQPNQVVEAVKEEVVILTLEEARADFEESGRVFEKIEQADGSTLRRYKLRLLIDAETLEPEREDNGSISLRAQQEYKAKLAENTLEMQDGTVLHFPLDLDPSTFVKLVSRGHRTFAPDFSAGTVAGQYSQANGEGGLINNTDFADFDFTTGTLDSRVTFTRASTATYTDSAGLIQSAAVDTPRFGYDPVTLAAKGLLIEEARTNLKLYSADLNLWGSKGNVAVTSDALAAPDGATTADKLVEAAVLGAHNIYNYYTLTAAQSYTWSTYAKAGERTKVTLWVDQFTSGGNWGSFDLSAGSVIGSGSAVTPQITNVGNGWYRLAITGTVGTTTGNIGVALLDAASASNYTGDGTSGLYIWGAQLEEGAFPTSYIPTTTAAATRAVDLATITDLSAIGYNASEGTLVAKGIFDSPVVSGIINHTLASLDIGTWTDRMSLLWWENGSRGAGFTTLSSVDQAQLAEGSIAVGDTKTLGMAYKANDFAFSNSGGAVQLDTAGTVPTVSQLSIGRRGDGAEALNGHISRLSYWPERLPNEQLTQITANGVSHAKTTATTAALTATDASGSSFAGNATGSSQDWTANGTSLRTNTIGAKTRFTTDTATEIWAGLTYSPAGGVIRATIDAGTAEEVVTTIDTYSATLQAEQKTLLATGLKNTTHTVELELTAEKSPKAAQNSTADSDTDTKLLIHSDTTNGSTSFTDSSASGHAVTAVGNVNHSTAQQKFGSTAMYFDGTGDYLSTPSSADFNFGSENLTIDAWVNVTTHPDINQFDALISQRGISDGWGVYIQESGGTYYLVFTWYNGSLWQSVNKALGASISAGWHHFAAVRDGDIFSVFWDGVQSSALVPGVTILDSAASMCVGYDCWGNYNFTGYLDEVRITKGKALWTSDFAVPTLPGGDKALALDYLETYSAGNELGSVSTTGTADSGTTTTLTDAALTSATTDFYAGSALTFTSGDNNGETVYVTAFDPATDTLTFTPAVGTAVGTETYQLTPDGMLINDRPTRGLKIDANSAPQGIDFEISGNLPTELDGSTKQGSFSIWTKPDFAATADAAQHFVFDSGLQRLYYDGADDKWYFAIYDGSNWNTEVKSAAQGFAAGDTIHLAASWNATSGIKLFVNGIKTSYAASWTAQNIAAASGLKFGVKALPNTVVDADGNTYSTVTIGDQLWMGENLNVGARIAAAGSQTDNSTVEKYCYSDSDVNCTSDGGLYQWDEAMSYATTEGAQGICMTGWHIPTDAEWYTLENGFDSGTCSATRTTLGCNPAGTALKEGGSSDFEAILAGESSSGIFYNGGNGAFLWSSSSNSGAPWIRVMYSGSSTISRTAGAPSTAGHSVRCLADAGTSSTASTSHFTGTLAEPQLFDYVLTDSEVYSMYSSTTASTSQAVTQLVTAQNETNKGLLFNAPMVGTPSDRIGSLAGSAQLSNTPTGTLTDASSFGSSGTGKVILPDSTDYEIAKSALFDGSTGYLSRTPTAAGNQKTWTYSTWVKRSELTEANTIFSVNPGSDYFTIQYRGDNDTLDVLFDVSTGAYGYQTSRVFRDAAEWAHVTLSVDSTQAVAGDRVKLYLNGVEDTSFALKSGYNVMPQNYNAYVNASLPHEIARFGYLSNGHFGGYLAENYFIDGQALTPASFGQTDAVTGKWIPKSYSGSYGTNGFKLDFSNPAALGADSSGNANNWTVVGGVTQTTDTPTDTYATLNPLRDTASGLIFSKGNTKIAGAASNMVTETTLLPSSGKWYFETYLNTWNSGTWHPYVSPGGLIACTPSGLYAGSTYYTVPACAAGTIFRVAFDVDTGKAWVATQDGWVNGGDPAVGTGEALTFTALAGIYAAAGSTTQTLNFGQDSTFGGVLTAGGNTDSNGDGDFQYPVPTGFKVLSTKNLPAVTDNVDNHWKTVTYTGTGATQSITGLGYQPDFVWAKRRTGLTESHILVDSVRGATKLLKVNTTGAESTNAEGITAFNSDGFSLGTSLEPNTSGADYVAWTANLPNTKTSGWAGTPTITPTMEKYNAELGMSIVKYTGNGVASATIPHSLGAKPGMIIIKALNDATLYNWNTYHKDLTDGGYYVSLNTTDAEVSAVNMWGNHSTQSDGLITLGTWINATNASGIEYIAYIFAESDFVKIGSYANNNSTNGPFINEGITPEWGLFKTYSAGTSSWYIYDDQRLGYNPASQYLNADTSGAEGTVSHDIDFVEGGAKLRTNLDPNYLTYSSLYLMIGEPVGLKAQKVQSTTTTTAAATTEIVASFATGTDRGIARVTVDAQTSRAIVTEIDTYAATAGTARFLVATGLDPAAHTVTIEATGTQNIAASDNAVEPKNIESLTASSVASGSLTVNGRLIDDVITQDFATLPNAIQFPDKGNISEAHPSTGSGQAGTIEAWVQTPWAGNDVVNHFILDTRDATNKNGIYVIKLSNATLYLGMCNATTCVVAQSSAMTSADWAANTPHHLTARWWQPTSTTMGLSFYLNGKKVAENKSQTFIPSNHFRTTIGNIYSADETNDFDGEIYDLSIYSNAFDDGGATVGSYAAAGSDVWSAYQSRAEKTEKIASQTFGATTVNAIDGVNTTFALERGGLLENTVVPEDGLVGYWPMDGDFNDYSSSGNDGTAMNAATFSSAGYFDQAGSFDGINSYFNTGTATNLPSGTGDFSVSTWVNPAQLDGDHRVIFANQSLDGFQLALSNGGAAAATVSMYLGGAGGVASSAQSWTLGQWYNILVTRKNGVVSLYRNGVHIGTGTHTGSITASTLDIGYRVAVSAAHPWDGSLDDLAIWDRALTAAEIETIYEGNTKAFINGIEQPVNSVSAGTYARVNNIAGLANIALTLVVDTIGDTTAIAPTGFLYLGNPSGQRLREKVYYSAWNGTDTFTLEARGLGDTTPVAWADNTIIEVVGSVTLATAPAAGADIYLDYSYSGDALDRSRGDTSNEDRILFLDKNENAATGWQASEDLDAETKLLIHSDTIGGSTTFTDSSTSGHAITPVGNVSHSADQKKFGDSSMYFDGTGDYLTVPDSADGTFGTDDFTIDAWVNPTAASMFQKGVISLNGTNGQGGALLFGYSDDGNNWRMFISSDGVNWDMAAAQSAGSVSKNTWQHLALTRSGNTFYYFKDGVLGSTWTSTAAIHDPISSLHIGKTTNDFEGYLDEVRITKGKARWTADFTPPATPTLTPAVATEAASQTAIVKLRGTQISTVLEAAAQSAGTTQFVIDEGTARERQVLIDPSSTSVTQITKELAGDLTHELHSVRLVAGAGGDLGQIFTSVRGWTKNGYQPVLKQDSSVELVELAPVIDLVPEEIPVPAEVTTTGTGTELAIDGNLIHDVAYLNTADLFETGTIDKTLTADITSTASTLVVTAADLATLNAFADTGMLQIDSETIYFDSSSKDTATLKATLFGLQRGYNNTTAAAHTLGATVRLPAATSWTHDDTTSWYTLKAGGGWFGVGAVDGSFPAAAKLIAGESGLQIIDAADDTLWMDFQRGAGNAITSAVTAVTFADGAIYAGTESGVVKFDFKNDTIKKIVGQNIYTAESSTGAAVDFADVNTGSFRFTDTAALNNSSLVASWDFDNFKAGKVADASGNSHDLSSVASWDELLKLHASDPAASDYFGISVAIDGDTAMIGAHADDDNALNASGSVYVFTRTAGVWTQSTKLYASDAAASDTFGVSVAIDGDTAMIGAHNDDDNALSASGSVYVFTRTAGVWTQAAKLHASDPAATDQFGGSVALDGDTAMIGAHVDDDNALTDSGSIYVFTRTAGVWAQSTKLHASDPAAGDYFGVSVAINGDTAMIGASADDDNALNASGSVYVFTRTAGVWTQSTKLHASDPAADDYFGVSVSIDGDTAMIGASSDDDNAVTDSGSVYIFMQTAGSWTQSTKLYASDPAAADQFGRSIAISGDTAFVGADADDDNTFADSGSAYLFDLRGPSFTADGPSGNAATFSGAGETISAGDTGSSAVKTVGFWVKPNGTTQSILTLNSTTSISATAGTLAATGVTTPAIYVNGAVGSTLTDNVWQFVTVTTSTGIAANSLTLGQVGASYLTGSLDQVFVSEGLLTAAEVRDLYYAGLASLRAGHTTSLDATTSHVAAGTESLLNTNDHRLNLLSTSSVDETNPTLDLDFKTGTLDDRVTFTRTTTGTYTDSAGVIQTAAIDTPRFGHANPRTNNYTQSQTLSTTGLENLTIAEAAGLAPDGTNTAVRLQENTVSSEHRTWMSVPLGSTTYTVSGFVKLGASTARQYVGVYNEGGWPPNAAVLFDLQNGAYQASSGAGYISSSIQAYPSGWYRISMTFTSLAAAGGVRFHMNSSGSVYNSNYIGDNASSFYLWGAQLEQAGAATDYIPTTTAAVTVAEPQGLLIEEARTNLIIQSEAFETWGPVSSTVTTNAITAPDGATTADKISETTDANHHGFDQGSSVLTSGQPHSISIFLKKGTKDWIYMTAYTGYTAGSWAFFNINTGTVGTVGADVTQSSVQDYGNGWYRVSMTVPASATTGTFRTTHVLGDNSAGGYLGNTADHFYAWGAQLELGSFPTSYIPTTTAAVTRAADVATITDLSTIGYNASEGALVAKGTFDSPVVTGVINHALASLDVGTWSEMMELMWWENASRGFALFNSSSTSQAQLFEGSIAVGDTKSLGIAYKVNDFAFSNSGGTVQLDTAGAVPAPTQLSIGRRGDGAEMLNGHISRLSYYPTRLTNERLQRLTAPSYADAIADAHFDSAENLYVAAGSTIQKVPYSAGSYGFTTATTADMSGYASSTTALGSDSANLYVGTNNGVEKLNLGTLARDGTAAFFAATGGTNNILSGTSNAVRDISYDARNDLLAVGTDAALSVIKRAGTAPTLYLSEDVQTSAIAGLTSDQITSLAWADGTPTKQDLLVGTEQGVNEISFVSNIAPSTPVLVSPASASATADTTPTLSAQYADADNADTGTMNYRVATSAANCLANTLIASGTSATTTTNNEATSWTPSSSLGSDGTYYWCAQADDGIAQTSWTSMGSLTLDTTSPTAYSAEINAPTTTAKALDLDFANTSTLDPRVTFTRASTGTYTNSAGVIQSAAVDTPRFDHTNPRTNLLLQSEDLTTTWGADGAIATASDQIGPDGTLSAGTLTYSSPSWGRRYQTAAISISSQYTASVWFKADSATHTKLEINTGGGADPVVGGTAIIDLSTGEVSLQAGASAGFSAKLEEVHAGGWYRMSVTGISSSTHTTAYIYMYASTDSLGAIQPGASYYYGAQLETGSSATDYIPTTTAAVTTAEPQGLLIEETRTNMWTYSDAAENAVYAPVRTIVTANTTTAPDGTATADALIEDASASSTHVLNQAGYVATVNGSAYTGSWFVKANGRYKGHLEFYINGGVNYGVVLFDLNAKTATSSGSVTNPSIEEYPNGWFRVYGSIITDSTQFAMNLGMRNAVDATAYTGDGTSGMYVWGKQVEAGSFPTSYIPTTSAAVTRAADYATVIDPNTIGYNASEGTIFADFTTGKDVVSTVVDLFQERGNFLRLEMTDAGSLFYNSTVGGVVQAAEPLQASTPDTNYKAAFAFRENDFAGAANGTLGPVDTAGTIISSAASLSVNSFSDFNGHFARLSYYPARLTNTELQTITTAAPAHEYTNTASNTFKLAATDTNLSQMRFGCDNTNWTSWEAYAASKTFDITNGATGCTTTNELKKIYTQFKDAADNTVSTFDTVTYDAVAPTTSAAVTAGTLGSNGWYTTDATVAITPADATSGVASMSYCVDQVNACVPSTAYTVPVVISTEATNYIRYTSTDHASNIQTTQSLTVNVDKTAPSIQTATLTSPNGAESWGGNTVHPITWTAGDITDATSGFASITLQYSTDGSTWTDIATGELNDGSYSWTTPDIDSSTVTVRIIAIDTAGLTASDASDAGFRLTKTTTMTTVEIDTGNYQIGGIDETLGTELRVRVSNGFGSYAGAGDAVVTFDVITAPTVPAPVYPGSTAFAAGATGGQTHTTVDADTWTVATDASGYAALKFNTADRAGLYIVRAYFGDGLSAKTINFVVTEREIFQVTLGSTASNLDLDPITTTTATTGTLVNITTNAASFDIVTTPNQWLRNTPYSFDLANWISSLGFGWDNNGTQATTGPFSVSLGNPDTTTIYGCSGDACQGTTNFTFDLTTATDYTNPAGSYANALPIEGINIVY